MNANQLLNQIIQLVAERRVQGREPLGGTTYKVVLDQYATDVQYEVKRIGEGTVLDLVKELDGLAKADAEQQQEGK